MDGVPEIIEQGMGDRHRHGRLAQAARADHADKAP